MENVFYSGAYKRSRAAYACQATLDYFAMLLISDAFLAKLLSSMGISDSLIGIISSFISVAFLFQIITIFFVQKIRNVKLASIFFITTSQLLFLSLYLIPLFSLTQQMRTTLVMTFVLLGYFANYFITSILFKWANSYVEPTKRSTYSATKEMISLISGMAFTYILGVIIDKYESAGRLSTAFLIFAVIMASITLLNFVCLLLIKSPEKRESENEAVPFREVIKNLFGNRIFIYIIILTVMWESAKYISLGFLGTFKTKDLMISVGTVQLINICGSMSRFLLSKPFGRYSDKKSYAAGMKLGLIISALAFACTIFTTKNTWWFIILYTVFNAISAAGTNSNSYNIMYSYVPDKYFVQASAIKNSIGGLFGFAMSLVGGKILAYVQANNNTFLGIHIFGQQLLACISLILIILSILFIHYFIQPKQTMQQ